jgi:hypothetical protein
VASLLARTSAVLSVDATATTMVLGRMARLVHFGASHHSFEDEVDAYLMLAQI